jgi:Protein tyrosine and serine/threonine kinase
MAPEVVSVQPYGLKADVFSFCMLLHEIMALIKPFDKLTGKEVKEQVAVLGRRPIIEKTWPAPIRKLLRRGFSEVQEIRPNMEDIQDILEDIVDSLVD